MITKNKLIDMHFKAAEVIEENVVQVDPEGSQSEPTTFTTRPSLTKRKTKRVSYSNFIHP